jgi:cytochrome c biogenesis protein CcmG, thiol:disulfide interchange protein DsbE
VKESIASPSARVAPADGRAPRRWLTLFVVLVPVVAVLALLGYGFTREARYIPSPLLGRPAPAFTLPLFGGDEVRLEELRGQVVFLNFWASWCPPCRAEARMLEAVWREYRDRDVVFIGANIQDQKARALAFLDEFDVTYPNGMAGAGRIAIDYGVWGLPETFIIDREGRITYQHVGAIGRTTITTRLDEALAGIVSATEGRGDYVQ